MRIRSITMFTSVTPDDLEDPLGLAGEAAMAVRKHLQEVGYEVQTIRAALPPLPLWAPDRSVEELEELGQQLEKAAALAGIEYLSIGPLLMTADGDRRPLQALPGIIGNTERLFASAFIANQGNLFTGAALHLAEVVSALAEVQPNGFGNLRFAVLANVPAGVPFFPAAYSMEGDVSFSLAVEAADLALDACRAARSPEDALHLLQASIENKAGDLEYGMDELAEKHGMVFNGCDWSLSPHPEQGRSIGEALEALTGTPIGGWGTLTAVATLTRAIKQAQARKVGFCSVFLPVLEDQTLAARAGEGTYTLRDLLLYSAVCGSGLDTIPLPGDTTVEAMAAALLDVGTLATVLNKPLTARLMPVPGLSLGEQTSFDFPYIVNSLPLPLNGEAAGLTGEGQLTLVPPAE